MHKRIIWPDNNPTDWGKPQSAARSPEIVNDVFHADHEVVWTSPGFEDT
jgi:hypothetical protein